MALIVLHGFIAYVVCLADALLHPGVAVNVSVITQSRSFMLFLRMSANFFMQRVYLCACADVSSSDDDDDASASGSGASSDEGGEASGSGSGSDEGGGAVASEDEELALSEWGVGAMAANPDEARLWSG